ncbi:NAD(P)/FAD-dependent oxidoreductase [Psychrobacter aquaticus]|uniref:Amine oxidase, flavin-containing n=1 Tax=Psychrobacter aquaticus CMS 56 TaxID=1354303 RepID=U4T1Q6_9GAMM|nr:NAD(P)-binding protein [Psychrobacter aquaticus]ERL54295.1 Amine oxidase, flavin-containing [Psychrobacter aquaticus CMS 56]
MTNHSSQSADLASLNIAIIGGGLTGLFTATLLERAFNQGHNSIAKKDQKNPRSPHITIFEKSRSVGRLATRYRTDTQAADNNKKNWQWAFGAQFFTAKTAHFQQFIAPWLETGLLQPWCARVVSVTPANDDTKSPEVQSKEKWNTLQARYISTPKMTSWGRVLADELTHTTIQFKTRVAPLAPVSSTQIDKRTELVDETGASLGWFDWVICTAPNGQAVELMADSGFARQTDILKPQMLACYTLMLGWDNEQQLPKMLNNQSTASWDVAYVSDSPLDRVFIEHQKPAHDELLPSITIHARNDWSEAHVDDDIDTIKTQLLQAAQQLLNWTADSAPSQIDCHRWRYAATMRETQNKDSNEVLGILIDEQHQWIVSGDWCGQGNIESCYQMAQEAVEAIISH